MHPEHVGTLDAPNVVGVIALVRDTCTGIPNGIRTRAAALKGRCPRPLDDGDRSDPSTIGRLRCRTQTDAHRRSELVQPEGVDGLRSRTEGLATAVSTIRRSARRRHGVRPVATSARRDATVGTDRLEIEGGLTVAAVRCTLSWRLVRSSGEDRCRAGRPSVDRPMALRDGPLVDRSGGSPGAGFGCPGRSGACRHGRVGRGEMSL